jgi:flagellin
MNRVAESLSSGERINRAADDAAGLAVSEKMRAQIRGLNQASRNAQDGVSLVQTAEGYLQEIGDILQRMGELSVQAANGVYTSDDRMQIQVEIHQLLREIDRIAGYQAEAQPTVDDGLPGEDLSGAAQFNTLKLLNGQFAQTGAEDEGMVIHVGANMDERVKIFIEAANTQALGLRDGGPITIHGTEHAAGTPVSVSTLDNANSSIATIQLAINKVSEQRANIGAFQNRLEHAIRGIDLAAENLQAAESRIRDTNMANAMVDYVKYNILTQTSASMLAQANITPQYVLRVLR